MSVEEFRLAYERHVNYVVTGDTDAAIADMVQENIPAVFEGIQSPRKAVAAFEIKDVRAEGHLMIGETVYDTGRRLIGLRSIWENHDGRWLAARLENFPADAPPNNPGPAFDAAGSITKS